MKRRLFSVFLTLCLLLALLPAYAKAEGTEYWLDMSADDARSMLNAVADESEERYIVFVYYDASTAPNPVESQFRKYANDKGYYIYGYHTGTGGSLLDALSPLFDGSTSLTLPVAVTWNPSTKTCMAKDNVRTQVEVPGLDFNGLVDLMAANGVSHGSSIPEDTGTPPVGPGDPENPPVDPGNPDTPPSSSSIPGVNAQSWEVLRLLNIYRMEKGLQPLSIFAGVQEAANIRARELFDYCSHTRPDGTDYSTVFTETGISRTLTSWAENIASGQKNAADVMNSWKNSPGHNANMIKPTGRVHVGIGYDYQTNGNPSLYATNWVQNFAAAYDCSFTRLQLSRNSIEGKPGTDLETLLKDAGIEVTASCYRHGTSSLPLIAAMCSGYDANSSDTQELAVSYGGQAAVLTITGTGHTHAWDGGTVTSEADCTTAGVLTFACSCGEAKTEAIPAKGHRFVADENGGFKCQDCGAEIPSAWKPVYDDLTENNEGNKLLYPHGEEGAGLNAEESGIQDYLKTQAETVLQSHELAGIEYSLDILNGKFNTAHTQYEYQIGIKALEALETQAFSLRRFDLDSEYILVTEPLVLFLNFGDSAEQPEKESTDVATPDGTASVDKPAEPSNPTTPSRPSGSSSGGSGSSASPSYAVTVPKVSGGKLAANPASAPKGRSVTVSVQPEDGYVLKTLKASDASGKEIALKDLGNGSYQFTMPGSKVTFTVEFAEVPEEAPAAPALNPEPMPFTDVSSGDWFYSGVDYVWKHYLMNGVAGTEFAPGRTTTRAMTWVILARMHGVDTDAEGGMDWFEKGRQWAMQEGVSDGTNPAGLITRQQFAAMLWRDAGCPGAAVDLGGFSDSALVSGYARTAISWAVETGVMQGSNGMLNPQNTASRAELAVMLARYAG